MMPLILPEPISRRLSASACKPDCTSALPHCARQLVAKATRRAAGRGIYAGSGRDWRAGRGEAHGTYTRMLTPLIDGLG